MPVLFRFAHLKYNIDLLKNGTIKMKHISAYREIEGNKAREDKLEGISKLSYPQWVKVELKTPNKCIVTTHPTNSSEINIKNNKVIETDRNQGGNVYCMMIIDDNWIQMNQKFDQRMNDFCDGHPSVLKVEDENVNEFLRRVNRQVELLGLKMHFGRVEYYDELIDQTGLSPFHKPSSLSYQNEFRIFVPRQADGILELSIGSIEDIAIIHVFDGNRVENMTLIKEQ